MTQSVSKTWSLALLFTMAAWGASAQSEPLPGVAVLTDGQTIEGRIRVRADGLVEIELDGAGGSGVLQLAPEAVLRIDTSARPEGPAEDAVVLLHDGRELRGRVRSFSGWVEVTSDLGRTRLSESEVAEVRPVLPTPPRVALDADLGIQLDLPDGWLADAPHGIGERLRLVRRDGLAWVSLRVRAPRGSGSARERIEAALVADLPRDVQWEPQGDVWRLRGQATDWGVNQHPLSLEGIVTEHDGLVVAALGYVDASGQAAGEDLDAATYEVERILGRLETLQPGRSRVGRFLWQPDLRLVVEAPPGFRVEEPSSDGFDAIAEVRSPERPDATLVVYRIDDDDAEGALLDSLDEADGVEALESGGQRLFVARSERERGVSYQVGEESVVVVVRAGVREDLVRLAHSVTLIDPAQAQAEVETLRPLLDAFADALRAWEDRRLAEVADLLVPVLEAYPEDPQALSLELASLREHLPVELEAEALDGLWIASGTPWAAEELAEALVEVAEEDEDYVAASAALERAAQVWPSYPIHAEVLRFFVGAAEVSYEGGDAQDAWAKLARCRRAIGPWPQIDETESRLRLEEANRMLVEEENPDGARREARRAYDVGAEADAVERIYLRAERLQYVQERKEELAQQAPEGQGGFFFGVPPTRTAGRSRRVRETAFTRPNSGSRRVRYGMPQERGSGRFRQNTRNANNNRRSRFFRPTRRGGTSRRVRTNGTFVFD